MHTNALSGIHLNPFMPRVIRLRREKHMFFPCICKGGTRRPVLLRNSREHNAGKTMPENLCGKNKIIEKQGIIMPFSGKAQSDGIAWTLANPEAGQTSGTNRHPAPDWRNRFSPVPEHARQTRTGKQSSAGKTGKPRTQAPRGAFSTPLCTNLSTGLSTGKGGKQRPSCQRVKI